jgi:hypothetical protein
MAKLILLVLTVGLFFSTTVTFIEKKSEKKAQEFKWEKPEKAFWLGNDYKSYKLDSVNVLKISDDFMNWHNANDTMWQDRFGRKIAVYNNQLIWTINDVDWVNVPERTWQSIDGNWYKLDTNWQLWQSKVGSDRFDAAY